MNVRRINAAKNFSNVSRFVIIITLLVFLILLSVISGINHPDKQPLRIRFWIKTLVTNSSLSNFTCPEVYNGVMNHTLYKNSINDTFDSSEIVLYYIKNCK